MYFPPSFTLHMFRRPPAQPILHTRQPPSLPQVGCAYGALFLATGSVACSALAHSLANMASGALWRAANPGADSSSSGSGS